MTTYREFSIEILPRKGFAARTWYFYRVTGSGLRWPIESDMGEQTEKLAIDAAKQFIDEHLAGA